MTKTLIEKWRDGKLPNGDYYIKVRGRLSGKEIFTYDNCINGKWAYTLDGNIIDVIEKVPSYDEFVQQREFVKDHQKVLIENMNLKRKLEIATKALKEYANCKPTEWMSCVTADKALKEMEGVK